MDRLSVRLYKSLEKIGVSEVMRAAHKEGLIQEIVMTTRYGIDSELKGEYGCELYMFGSQTEGTTTYDMGSDLDMVLCYSGFVVYADIREATDPAFLLIIQDEHSRGGYVKIQPVEFGRPLTIYDKVVSRDMWKPDRFGRLCWLVDYHPGQKRHGPAFDASDDVMERDGVPAVKCFSVPECAKVWLHRHRPYGWPSRDSLIRLSSLPCFLVDVGHPYSDERELERRLSFSLHERELMISLNPVQHQCYTFMKMVKKNIIQHIIGEESITSYHFKTCLFWAIENTAPDHWRADNMIPCLKVCFKLLYKFLRRKYCPNFFLPEANLFEREVIDRLQEQLLSLINAIRSDMFMTIANIQCSGLGSTFITGQVPRPVSEGLRQQRLDVVISVVESNLCINKTISELSHSCKSFDGRVSTLHALLLNVKERACITAHTEEQTREAKTFILPAIHFRLAICLAAEILKLKKGQTRKKIATVFVYHLRSSECRDLVGAFLVLASLKYKLRRYDECEVLLEEIDSRLTATCVMSICQCGTTLKYHCHRNLGMKVVAENMSAREILATSVVTCITFLPCERALVPEALLQIIEQSRGHTPGAKDEEGHDVYEWVTLDGMVYFYFLQYLVYSELNKPVKKRAAANNLIKIIVEDPSLCHRETALSLLEFVKISERNKALVFQSWRPSLESFIVAFFVVSLTIVILLCTFFFRMSLRKVHLSLVKRTMPIRCRIMYLI